MGARIGLYDGYIEYFLPNIATLIYVFPAILASFFILNRDNTIIGSSSFTLTAILLCIGVAIITGRRAVLLIFVLSPIIIYLLASASNIRLLRPTRVLAFGFSILFSTPVVFTLLDINMSSIIEDFMTGFNFDRANTTESSYLRAKQFYYLYVGWAERPFLGHGLGSSSPHILRSDDHPWAYELSYAALLFQTGIAGALIYGGSVVWLFLRSIAIMRKRPETVGYIFPPLVGLTCFLIANATNPYLLKFDYLWALFLSVGLLRLQTH